jgi:Insertion element 4 transposase N-terminal/Transposase DDE domain
LTAALPPELVDLAIEEWDAREERYRMLPARVMAYYTMACVMNFDASYDEVWIRLIDGLSWARRHRQRKQAGMLPTTAALHKGRVRLGWSAMAEILQATTTRPDRTPHEAPWAYFHGLRILAIDGFTLNVDHNPQTVEAFGLPTNAQGAGSYPQVRVVALAEIGTRGLQGAEVAGLGDGEQTLARRLWPRLHEGDVVVGDRGFLSYTDLQAIVATGAHAVIRAKAGWDLPVLEVLSDGSWISRIADPEQSRRLRRRKVPGHMIPGIRVRVIEYTVATAEDTDESEVIRLVTTLTDPQRYPLADFPDLYHDRWRLETAIGDIETRLRGGPDVILRSRRPDLILQEVYALLCVYQALRAIIAAGADYLGIDPDRVSFTRAKHAAARHSSDDAAFSP